LAQRDKKELLSIKGFGKSVVNELEGVLDKKKLSLGMDLRRLIS
jgi:DNA-directed RNA polymerase alpha subunit